MNEPMILYTTEEGGVWRMHKGEDMREAAAIGLVLSEQGRLIVFDRVLDRRGNCVPLRYAPLPDPMPE